MRNITKIALIIIIFLIGAFLRLYKLGDVPKGLYLDEASIGYNAYSILKTGRDEYGKKLPITFRSFSDFKTPVYIYSVVPSIKAFGLNKFAVRFPSFVFGSLTVIVLFLIIHSLSPQNIKFHLSLLSSLLLCFSPWHILFSRTAFESNIALFFFLLGIYCFYRFISLANNRIIHPLFIFISSISFSISFTAYHAERFLVPAMIIYLLTTNFKNLLNSEIRKYLFLSGMIFLIFLIPTLSIIVTPGFSTRVVGLNIFIQKESFPAGYLNSYQGFWNFIINNQIFLKMREFMSLYFSYYLPRNMFILGDYEVRMSLPNLSTFYYWQFPFYLFGLYSLIKDRKLKTIRSLTLFLFFLSPIPAAITKDPYSTIRSLPLVIPTIIVISLGIIKSYEKVSGKIFSIPKMVLFSLGMAGCLVYSVLKIYSSFFVLGEYYHAPNWNYGFEEVVEAISKLDNRKTIIFDNARVNPYSEVLFFSGYDPATYQKTNIEINIDDYYLNTNSVKNKQIGNISIRPVNWKTDLERNMYLIGDSIAISEEQIKNHSLQLIKKIYYPDGSEAFTIVEVITN
jgi:4-amino-4-deoxy-L-arabinose transferase-like glycosyltransferase